MPWVDANDPEWQKSFNQYSSHKKLHIDSSINRYRDWGLLKYWFRGVEKYAPWVNTVHFITSGHYPEWLNLSHPKLNFVKHEDYIPKQYLPTFSANPIELNLHRIASLSEHFVYFNDDIFIKSKLDRSWFFKNGQPCDAAILTAYSGANFSKIILNSNHVINNHYDKFNTIRENPLKWFNIKYGPQLIRTFLLLPWKEFTGFYDYHLTNAYLKSTLQEVWEKEEIILNETSLRKFRHDMDVNQYIFRYWQLTNNNFNPISKHRLGDYFSLHNDSITDILDSLHSNKKPLICLNDDSDKFSVERKDLLQDSFESILPNKCSFEV